jgi:hypothetical protein
MLRLLERGSSPRRLGSPREQRLAAKSVLEKITVEINRNQATLQLKSSEKREGLGKTAEAKI